MIRIRRHHLTSYQVPDACSPLHHVPIFRPRVQRSIIYTLALSAHKLVNDVQFGLSVRSDSVCVAFEQYPIVVAKVLETEDNFILNYLYERTSFP